MGKLRYILFLFLFFGCSNSSYHAITGHSEQSETIERTFQHALEFNADGVLAHWHDKNTGKSGYVKPKYPSGKFKGPCRHFEMAYFYTHRSAQYFNGIACRRGQVWQIH